MLGCRSLVAALLCILAFFNFGVLGAQSESRNLTIADIPACGLRCLIQELPLSNCAATDVACICASDQLEHGLAACLLANCTMQEMLDSSRVQADMCHLSNESKTRDVILYTAIMFPIAWISVVLRFAGKWVSSRLSWDDAVVAGALLLTALPLGCVLHMAVNGFGEHLWNLQDGKLSTILRSLYISWTSYVIVLCMIKISLTLFYLEIFKTQKFRITAYIFLVFLVANSITVFCVALFTCTPIQSFWDRDIKTGKCISLQASAYFISASSLVQDIVLLVLPIVFIRNLQMKRHRKIAVGIMFVVGTFGCVATLMRLPSLSTFKISIDPCWDYVPVTIWTEIELGVGFVCISLPSIRVLLVKILPHSLKRFVSSYTTNSRSKSRSNAPVQRTHPTQQKPEWGKSSTWVQVSADRHELPDPSNSTVKNSADTAPPVRSSFLTAFWNRNSSTPRNSSQLKQLSQLRNGSQRLESPLSNYSQVGIAVTKPSFQDGERERRSNEGGWEQVEMLSVPTKAHKHRSTSCRSCQGDEGKFTALPQIGCIPDRSYSVTKLSEKFRREREKEKEKDMV